MIRPTFILGQGGGNDLFVMADDAVDDAGEDINLRAASPRIAPAGIGGECIFTTCWLAIEHTMAVTLRFTFYVDGVALESQDVILAAQGTPTTRIFEFGLFEPLLNDLDAEYARNAPRGAWFQVRVETVGGLGAGILAIEGRDLEVDVVRESRAAEPV